MKINNLTMGILIFILIFGGIGATMAVDIWSTQSEKQPAKYATGSAEGSYNPADIRGSYTFQEIADLFQIELTVLYEAFQIPADTVGTEIQTKDLEGMYAESGVTIGNETVQLFVALYLGLPITLDESVLTAEAVQLIKDHNKQLTEEQLTYLDANTVNVIASSVSTTTEVVETEATTENVVNGSATFQKVLDAGVTVADIEKIIGAKMPPTNQTVKDYCIEVGLSFSEVKNQLNGLIQ